VPARTIGRLGENPPFAERQSSGSQPDHDAGAGHRRDRAGPSRAASVSRNVGPGPPSNTLLDRPLVENPPRAGFDPEYRRPFPARYGRTLLCEGEEPADTRRAQSGIGT